MKRFVIQSILFIGLFTLVMFPICGYNKMILKNVLSKEQILPKVKTVLALGDSHVECSMDETYFPEMVNKSKSGEVIFYSLAKNRFYADNDNISVILFSFNYFTFRNGKFDEIQTEAFSGLYTTYLPLLILYPDLLAKVTPKFYSREFILPFIVNKFGIPHKANINYLFHENLHPDFSGGFLKGDMSHLSKINVDEKIKAHYNLYNTVSHFGLDYNMVEFIYRICETSKEKNIQLVFYNAPCHPEYNKRVPQDAIHKTDSLAVELQNKYNAIYLNYHDYPMPNDSCFRDYDHLNTRGAAIITPIVRDTLIKLGVIPDKEII